MILVSGYLVSMMLCNVVVVFLLVGHMCLQIMLQAMLIMKRVPWDSSFVYACGCVPTCIVTGVHPEGGEGGGGGLLDPCLGIGVPLSS